MAEQTPAVGMQRKLAAIFSTDVAGYSRLMGNDEEATIRTLTTYRVLIASLIQQYRGRVVDAPGDNLLAEFVSVVDAVRCAVEIQHALKAMNAELPEHRQMRFRIGINLGDVIVEGERLYGDGVNIAARMESLALPGGICLSGTVYDHVENKLALTYDYQGEQTVKNIAKPVRVYRVVTETADTQPIPGKGHRTAAVGPSRRVRFPYRWITAAVVLLVATFGILWYGSRPSLPPPSSPHTSEAQPPALPLPDKPSIAVLPFTNMSGDLGQEYISDGMTEAIITDLSKLSGLFVIARNSAFTYKGKAVKVNNVGRELGVRYVLEGSVQKADNRVRVTAQLVEATTGGHLWAKNYDREWKDIFVLQDDITQQIGAALRVEVWEAERERVRHIPTINLTAYDAILRGNEQLIRFTKEANSQARQFYERAIALDPQYAEAYASLAWTYLVEFIFRWSPDPQMLERAFATAQQAVALDDSLPLAHMTLGTISLYKEQPEQALVEAEQAITLDPNFAEGYAHLGSILNATGKPDEALKKIETALRLNPRPPFYYHSSLGESYARLGRFAEAIAAQKQVLLRNPNFLPAYGILAEIYWAQWDSLQTQDPQVLEWAMENAQKIITLSEHHPWGYNLLARAYFYKKEYEQAIAEAERTISLVPNDADNYATLSFILSYAGQPEKALEKMKQALRLNPNPPGWYFQHLGQAYRLMGRMKEALVAQQKALTLAPDKGGIHIELAVLYSEAGREEEARAEIAELRRLMPTISLETLKPVLVYKDSAETERVLAALRKVGLK